MAKIRTLPAGSGGRKTTKYQVTYRDAENKRRFKDFDTPEEADRFQAQVKLDVLDRVHVPSSQSLTVEEVGKLWIDDITDAKELERSSIQDYERTLRLHIKPLIGRTKLTALDEIAIRTFIRDLQKTAPAYPSGRTPFTAKRTLTTLGILLNFACKKMKPKPVRNNIVHDMADEIAKSFKKTSRKSKPKIGEDIPSKEDIRALEKVLSGRLRPLILTALYTGLRASELRGLRWMDVKLDDGELYVTQKADRFNQIGSPKSETSFDRMVALPKKVTDSLAEWKDMCPELNTGKLDAKGKPVMKLDLVFPNGLGRPETLGNILKRELHLAWVKAGVTSPDDPTKPKYTGLHCLRHFYASWLINSRERGGRGKPAKEVQILLGHSSLKMTTDTYTHVFNSNNDKAELDADSDALLP